MFPSPRTKSTKDVENRSICGVDDVTLGDSDHEEGSDRPSCTVVAKASRMVALQVYDGSWSLTRELADVVDTTKDTQDKAFSVDEKVWANGLAICWLTLKCADERSVWEMVVNKARDWLVRQLGQEEEYSLHGEAERVLSLERLPKERNHNWWCRVESLGHDRIH